MKGTHILMHKGDKVATCSFDARGYLKSVSKIHNEKLLPLCIGETNPLIDMQRWILSRSLAANRSDIAPLRDFYGSSTFLSNTGLSLFDCYWFANGDSNDWEKENPYDNWNHKRDGLYLMLLKPDEFEDINANSPNLTIPGRYQRLWYRANDGQLCLLHGEAQQEMNNYKLANGSPIVAERSYAILSGKIYVLTYPGTSKEIERISLADIYNLFQNPNKSKMENLQICCEKFGISNWRDYILEVCEFDERIGNTNRELSDIFLLRDTNTLEIINFAQL